MTLLTPVDIRQLADRLDIRPTKQLGQTFVVDPNTIRRIVQTARVAPSDAVLEVGPGFGSLTLALLGAASSVTAIEIDRTLADALPVTVATHAPHLADRLTVIQADAMTLTDPPGRAPTVLVANLPYNVAVPVLLHLLDALESIQRALVMVQMEVALRLAAAPGSRRYGVPSAKLRWYCDVQLAGAVSRTVFWPVPNVDSALLALARRSAPSTAARRDEVFAVVDAAFAQRRKTLRAALAGWAGSATTAEEILRAAGIDPRTRGEALSIADFARIAERRRG